MGQGPVVNSKLGKFITNDIEYLKERNSTGIE